MLDKATQADLIRAGFDLLRKERLYNQREVVAKLHSLGVSLSKATFSKLINDLPVGEKITHSVAEGICVLVRVELGKMYEPGQGIFVTGPGAGGEETVVPKAENSPDRPSLIFHDRGRLPVQEKVNFILGARKEVVEIGVRLATFTNYFHSRSSFEFRDHIEEMLSNGINFKLYLLAPDSNEASFYFRDRARVSESDENSVEVIRQVQTKLQKIRDGYLKQGLKGKIELYTYKHLPSQHFTLVDGGSRNGKMIVSHYLYGIPRADSPVIQIEKAVNPDLYRLYYRSYKAIVDEAQPFGLR
ncbi:hypothetical protein CEQ90_05215 [Lewinellaceae bacterium SD302]|nr:hypothetical protein CEQ90_05215 [Lewinellaceae bacterium SD302]